MKTDRCLVLGTARPELTPCGALTRAIGNGRGSMAWVLATYPGPQKLGYVIGVTLDGAPLLYCPWCGQGLLDLQKVAPESHIHPLFDHKSEGEQTK